MKLRYGEEDVDLKLLHKVDIITPNATVFGPRLDEAIERLRPALSAARKITIVIPDATRPASHRRILPALAPLLVGKAVNIVVACGAHAAPAQEYQDEARQMVPGSAIHVHNCDLSPLIDLGVTSRGTPVLVNCMLTQSDINIGIGSVAIHPFAGFSGGPKAFVPGCAGRRTITANHSLLVSPEAVPHKLIDNPLYADLVEAVGFLPTAFVLNEALDASGAAAGFFAGHFKEAHLEASLVASESAAAIIPHLYPTVIASCGGYPRDINLYQAVKALDMSSAACEPGGTLILLAECREGVGSELYEEWARKSWDEQEHMVKTNFTVGAHKAYLTERVLRRLGRAILISELKPYLVEEMGFTPAGSLTKALEMAKVTPSSRMAVVPFGTTTLPILKGTD